MKKRVAVALGYACLLGVLMLTAGCGGSSGSSSGGSGPAGTVQGSAK